MCAMSEGRLSLMMLEAPSAWMDIVGEARSVLMSGLAAWPASRELVVSLRVRSFGGASCSGAVGGAVAVTGSVMAAELFSLASQRKQGRVSQTSSCRMIPKLVAKAPGRWRMYRFIYVPPTIKTEVVRQGQAE